VESGFENLCGEKKKENKYFLLRAKYNIKYTIYILYKWKNKPFTCINPLGFSLTSFTRPSNLARRFSNLAKESQKCVYMLV
jgi:hypothetical protein